MMLLKRCAAPFALGLMSLLTTARAADADNAPAPQRIVFLGDSITDGHTYPLLLRQALSDAGKATPVCINAGIGGDTAAGMKTRLDRDVLTHRPTLVTLLVGTNDAHRQVTPEAYAADVSAICQRLKAEKVPLVLLTPPITGPKAADMEKQVDRYVAELQRLAGRFVLPLADVNARMKQARELGVDVMEADQIHPNYQGHRVIARTLLDALGHKDVPLPHTLKPDPLPGVVSPWRLRGVPRGDRPLDETSAADVAASAESDPLFWTEVTLPESDPHPVWWLDQERQRGVAVSLERLVGKADAYHGVAAVEAKEPRKVYFNVGADLRSVWLNGKPVYQNDPAAYRGWHPGRERVPAELRAGVNTIVIKAGGQFFLSITDDNTW